MVSWAVDLGANLASEAVSSWASGSDALAVLKLKVLSAANSNASSSILSEVSWAVGDAN